MSWEDSDYAAFDLETSGELPEYSLQPWRVAQGKAWATSLVWVWREPGVTRHDGGLFPTNHTIEQMLEWALDERRILVAWNAVFDISWLYAYCKPSLVNQCRFLDGMLLWRHLDIEPEYDESGRTKRSYSLKGPGGAVPTFLPQYAGYQEDIDYHSTDPAELEKLHRYNVIDSTLTLRLAKKFWNQLRGRQQTAAIVEAQSLAMVAHANLEGMIVDPLEAAQLSQWLKDTAARKLASLGPHGITEEIVRSPAKLGKVMFDDWKLPVLKENESKKTGKVSRSTDKETLHELAFMDPRAKELREYREALNCDTKFAQAPIKAVAYNEDGKAHPAARVFGTYSGRLTYSSKQGKIGTKEERQIGFALHQEKRDKEFRRIIVPPAGHTLVEFDAAGQEFRWMALASKDQTMLSLCLPGEDPHSFMASKIIHKDYSWVIANKENDPIAKNGRKSGKVANLCCAAGTMILTDRGPCSIEQIRRDDLVWDGQEFVAHDGVSFSGVREVITYDAVLATPDHRVMVNQEWVRLDEAQCMGRPVDRACSSRNTVRIMAGLARRAVREVLSGLRASAMRLWDRARCKPEVHGDGAVFTVQGLRYAHAASPGRQLDSDRCRDEAIAEARQCMVSTMQKRKGSIVPQLWRPWDRVSLCISVGRRRVYQAAYVSPNLSEAGYRPQGQRWSLRAWKLALGHTQGEPCEPRKVATYDIVNCGPRSCFSANGRIVHNSLQYRTSAGRLLVTARVDYNMPMTIREARTIHSVYRNTYTRVPVYWDEQIIRTKALGYVETFAGRRVKVQGDWSGTEAWRMGSTAINYRIQGTGADQKYLALMCLRDLMDEYDIRFGWDLHDGLYFYVPDDNVYDFVRKAKDILDNLPYEAVWRYKPTIPLPWDAKVGPSWGALKEYEFT